MTFLYPSFLVAGILAAVAVVAAHLIVVRHRTSGILPTVRFVPRETELAPTVQRRPADLIFLVMRALAVLAAGFALARPVVAARDSGVVPIVIADLSPSGDIATIVDRATAAARDPRARLIFAGDSIAIRSSDDVSRLAPERVATAGGTLTAGLVAAIREATRIGGAGSRASLSIVSPLTTESVDEATAAVRGMWPGRIELVPVRLPVRRDVPGSIELRAPDEDIVRIAFTLVPARALGGAVRVVRDSLTSADSAAAAAGAVVIAWPARPSAPQFVPVAADTVAGIVSGGATVLAEFVRSSLPRVEAGDVVRARWIDGPAVVTERAWGRGCVRFVALSVPTAGDVAISRVFTSWLRDLVAACGVGAQSRPLDASARTRLAGAGPSAVRLASAAPESGSQLTPYLLAAALFFLVAELLLRRVLRGRR